MSLGYIQPDRNTRGVLMPETRKYLKPAWRAIEIFAALYGLSFGLYICYIIWTTAFAPLAWTGTTEATQATIGLMLILGGFSHGVGIRVNGKWPYSPVLRAIGLGVHVAVLGWLATHTSSHYSSSTFTYAFLGAWFTAAEWSAIYDAVQSITRGQNAKRLI